MSLKMRCGIPNA